jgi:ribosomal protein S18 acetylase RimI-like enzyme
MYTWHPFAGPADLRAMQALVSESWKLEKPRVNVHVGDLEWWTAQRKEPEFVSLWHVGDELVGWAWNSPPAELDTHIHRDHREGPLFGLMLEWFERSAADQPSPPGELGAFAFEPTPDVIEALGERGYEPAEPHHPRQAYVHHVRPLVEPLLPPVLPDGFSVRHVRGTEDLEQRVEVHRSAFAPSRMTVDRYGMVMGSQHYRLDLDWVAVAPDERFAAFCLVWLDAENAVGLLEPVGTGDRYRRLGLARAVCLAAMDAARLAGADTAIVLSDRQNAASMALYRDLGFQAFGCSERFVKAMR